MATLVTAAVLAAVIATPAGALNHRSSPRHTPVPSITVRTEHRSGQVARATFGEQLDNVTVHGLQNPRAQARINRSLARYIARTSTTFEAQLPDLVPPNPTITTQLTITAISTYTSARLTSVVFQDTLSSYALAHPYTRYDAFTFNRTGRTLSIRQIIHHGALDDLARIATPFVTRVVIDNSHSTCRTDPATIASLFTPQPDAPAAHLGFTRTGLLLAFDDYSFNAYYCGTATVTLPYPLLIHVLRVSP